MSIGQKYAVTCVGYCCRQQNRLRGDRASAVARCRSSRLCVPAWEAKSARSGGCDAWARHSVSYVRAATDRVALSLAGSLDFTDERGPCAVRSPSRASSSMFIREPSGRTPSVVSRHVIQPQQPASARGTCPGSSALHKDTVLDSAPQCEQPPPPRRASLATTSGRQRCAA